MFVSVRQSKYVRSVHSMFYLPFWDHVDHKKGAQNTLRSSYLTTFNHVIYSPTSASSGVFMNKCTSYP